MDLKQLGHMTYTLQKKKKKEEEELILENYNF